MTKKEKEAAAVAKAEEKAAKAAAKAKAKAEAEAKAEAHKLYGPLISSPTASTKAETTDDDLKTALIEEAKTLGIELPRLSLAGLRVKDPKIVAKEEIRQKKQFIHLLQTAIAKNKANAKMKPIDKRRALLVSRFKAVKSRNRPSTYSDANIKAWIEELNMINNNPKSWNKVTKNGTVNFVPGNKKKKTARDVLDEMDLEDKDEDV